MSRRKGNRTGGQSPNAQVKELGRRAQSEEGWRELREGMGLDLEELCQEGAAIQRRRQIRTGEVLLRLALLYAVLSWSLRSTVEWAARAGLARLSDEALGWRLARAPRFLELVLGALLSRRLKPAAGRGVRLRIRDATVPSVEGSGGTLERLHVEYDPQQGCCTAAGLHGAWLGESLQVLPAQALDLVVGDMGLAHARGLHAVAAQGAFSLVRVHLQNLRLERRRGEPLSIEWVLERAEQGRGSFSVWVPLGPGPALVARLLVRPLKPQAAARARQKMRKHAAKKGRAPDAMALRLAGYLCLLTTLPSAAASDRVLCCVYRLRWQVELLFKRYKSLLGLRRIRRANEPLRRIQILGKLIAAAAVEHAFAAELCPPALDEESSGRPAISLWRLTHLHFCALCCALLGPEAWLFASLPFEPSAPRLRERPRKRRTAASAFPILSALLNNPQPYDPAQEAA